MYEPGGVPYGPVSRQVTQPVYLPGLSTCIPSCSLRWGFGLALSLYLLWNLFLKHLFLVICAGMGMLPRLHVRDTANQVETHRACALKPFPAIFLFFGSIQSYRIIRVPSLIFLSSLSLLVHRTATVSTPPPPPPTLPHPIATALLSTFYYM